MRFIKHGVAVSLSQPRKNGDSSVVLRVTCGGKRDDLHFEIFIVMLITGHIGGILGMLAAIPAYTVIRVIAGRFFYDKKFVQRLMPDLEKEITK